MLHGPVTIEELARQFGLELRDDFLVFEGSLTPQRDREVLYRLAVSLEPRLVVEIGTFRGETARGLALNCPTATIIMIDIHRGMEIEVPENQQGELLEAVEVGRIALDAGLGDRVRLIFGDSREPATYNALPDAIDFAFIDANHTYQAVLTDSRLVIERAAPDAVVAWHDFARPHTPEVRAALDVLAAELPNPIYPVAETMLAVTRL